MPSSIAKGIGTPTDIALATKIEHRPAFAPTDKSHSSLVMGTSAASVTTAITDWFPITARRLPSVPKVAAVLL
jgi:hypothetical protein